MKKKYIFLIVLIAYTFVGCNKETNNTSIDVLNNLITNKNWYLEYTITEITNSTLPVIKSYVGQTTYFVTYLKNGDTKDSDGLTGTYSIEAQNNQYQIHVKVKTTNGNSLEVIYNIISAGASHLVIAKAISGTSTKLYFTSK